MADFGEAVLNAVLAAAQIEHMCHVRRCGAVRIFRREAELDPNVGQDRVDFVGTCGNQGDQEG